MGLMKHNLYECHITFDAEGEKDLCRMTPEKRILLLRLVGGNYTFHFSQIDGDPEMGAGVRKYLTKSLTDSKLLEEDMIAVCDILLDNHGIVWARRKIEQILLDERRP